MKIIAKLRFRDVVNTLASDVDLDEVRSHVTDGMWSIGVFAFSDTFRI
jgi:hypothetical protein